MAYDVGESMGGFIDFDDADPLGWDEVMRIKVMLDLNKPLRRRVKIVTSKTSFKGVGVQY